MTRVRLDMELKMCPHCGRGWEDGATFRARSDGPGLFCSWCVDCERERHRQSYATKLKGRTPFAAVCPGCERKAECAWVRFSLALRCPDSAPPKLLSRKSFRFALCPECRERVVGIELRRPGAEEETP